MNEYLPLHTHAWCQRQLQQLGFDPTQPSPDSTAPYRTIYLQLRTALDLHITSGNELGLDLSQKPTGAFNWQPVAAENVRAMDLGGDGAEEDEIDEN